MVQTKRRVGVILVAILCLPLFWILASDRLGVKASPHIVDTEPDAVAAHDVGFDEADDDRALDEDDEDEDGDEGFEDIEFLGKTIKLEFMLLPQEDDEPSFTVVTAIHEYAIHEEVREGESEHSVELTGQLRVLDDDGKQILLTCEATLHDVDEKEDAETAFHAYASTVLIFHRAKTLARLGDKTLAVRATIED